VTNPPPHNTKPRLRDQYLLNPQRTAQLLETFPLQAITKKVQPQGGGLRCAVHRRAAALQAGGAGGGHHGGHRHHHHHHHHHQDSWDWEDAWERLPGNLKARVATIEVASLEAAMHQATATHRFCVDCKHNVVTALDLLVGRCVAGELENKDEYNADLFKPFAGRVLAALPGPGEAGAGGGGGAGTKDGSDGGQEAPALPAPPAPERDGGADATDAATAGAAAAAATAAGEGETALALSGTGACASASSPLPSSSSSSSSSSSPGGRKVLACDVNDVEELISWHEDFDSQEYAASGQRHAATLEHGQREIRSLVGALLLAQLRSCWHAHTAQVQAEQVRASVGGRLSDHLSLYLSIPVYMCVF
jgi:hypothetical protein